MKISKKIPVFLALILFAISCSSSSSDTKQAPVTSEVSTSVPQDETVDAGNETEPSPPNDDLKDSNYIFDQNKLHTFELVLPQEALDEIDADPMAEKYVEGELVFEGETIGPVGIRYKGSVGAWVGCVGEGAIFADGGAKACTKLSMKVKINWDDPDAEFFGLRKLQFHSQNLDQTLMHERLGYWLFREMGVPAPRSVHSRLVVNGEFVGLFALTEQIDGRFTRHNFEDGTGNLYKEVWPIRSNGEPKSNEEFYEGLKTNENDDDLDMSQIISFSEQMATFRSLDQIELAETVEGMQEIMRSWMDIEEIISYAVVDRSIRNDDGAFHWYCSFEEANFGGECNNHNFYWYANPSTGKMHLIPWDLDNSFENILADSNPVTPVPDKWGEVRNDCAPFSYGMWNLTQKSAACDKIIWTWTTFDEEYEQIYNEFMNGPFAREQVESLLDTWEEQISPVVQEAEETHDDAIPFEVWQGALERFRQSLAYARGEEVSEDLLKNSGRFNDIEIPEQNPDERNSSDPEFWSSEIELFIDPEPIPGQPWSGTISGKGLTPSIPNAIFGCPGSSTPDFELCDLTNMFAIVFSDQNGEIESEEFSVPMIPAAGGCFLVGNSGPDKQQNTGDEQGAFICTK